MTRLLRGRIHEYATASEPRDLRGRYAVHGDVHLGGLGAQRSLHGRSEGECLPPPPVVRLMYGQDMTGPDPNVPHGRLAQVRRWFILSHPQNS